MAVFLFNNTGRGSVSTTYNAGTGQVTNINGSYTNDSYTPTYTFNYDNAGRIKKYAVGSNGTANFYSHYFYTNDRLSKVQLNGIEADDTAGTSSASYEYYPDGKLKTVTYPQLVDGTSLDCKL